MRVLTRALTFREIYTWYNETKYIAVMFFVKKIFKGSAILYKIDEFSSFDNEINNRRSTEKSLACKYNAIAKSITIEILIHFQEFSSKKDFLQIKHI